MTPLVLLVRVMLLLSPPTHRRAWGSQITATIRARVVEARQRGRWASARIALAELTDLAVSGLRARFSAGVQPTRNGRLPRLSAADWPTDIRHAWRRIRAAWATSIGVVTMFALAVGLTTAAFAVLDALIARRVPFKDADRLFAIWLQMGPMSVAPSMLDGWRRATVFEAVEGFSEAGSDGLAETERAAATTKAAHVTPGLFSMLGVMPRAGRLFGEGDAALGSDPVALISEGLWGRLFDRSRSAIGSRIILNGTNVTVVGVLPAHVLFPKAEVNAWLPVRSAMRLRPLVRVRSGVSVDAALLAAARVADAVEPRTTPWRAERQEIVLTTGHIYTRGAAGALGVAVGLVFVTLCLNICGLLMARFTARTREFALCSALGASRQRMVTQSIVESVLLGVAGSGLGLGLAWGLLAAAQSVLPAATAAQTLNVLDLDRRALAFAGGSAFVAMGLTGLLPAWFATRPHGRMLAGLSSPSTTHSRLARGATNAFLIGQVALTCTLLAGAVIVVRSYLNLSVVPLGYDPRGLVTMTFSTRGDEGTPAGRAKAQALVDLLAHLPGVRAVSLSVDSPIRPASFLGAEITPDVPGAAPTFTEFHLHRVEPSFFDLYGITPLRGRLLQEGDEWDVVLIGSRTASLFWPGQDPIGRRFTIGDGQPLTVVGVTDETSRPRISAEWAPIHLYVPYVAGRSHGWPGGDSNRALTFRCNAACPTEGEIRQRVQRELAGVSIGEILRFEDVQHEDLAPSRAAAWLGTSLATVGLVCAAAGLFAALSYTVSRRRREFGIRLALGSPRRAIQALVFREGATVVGMGVLVGGVLAWAVGRLLASVTYEASATDSGGLGTVLAILAATTVLACWWPARDAMRTDPFALLKEE